jgi:serine/threonine protein kinase
VPCWQGLSQQIADIYSLRAILYESLAGQPPFKANSALGTLRQVMENAPERPRALNREVDRGLETIFLKHGLAESSVAEELNFNAENLT